MTDIAAERAQDIARRVHGAPEAEPPTPAYVGLVTRAVAFVIDAAIINVVAAVVAAAAALVISVFPIGHNARTVLVAIGGAVYLVWLAGYFTVFWSSTGQTPGNRIMQIRVLPSKGGRMRPRRAFLRAIGLVLAAIPLFAGYVPILLTDRRRGLADWMADTVVITAPAEPAARHDGRA
jgi:uncharacterized RDD family membrane protein YckC